MENSFGQFAELENSGWMELHKKSGKMRMWLLLLCSLTLSAIILIIFVEVDIGISAPGIIRPVEERTDIRSFVSGMVDSLYCKEGGYVKKGDIVLTLKDQALRNKAYLIYQQAERCRHLINDLNILTSAKTVDEKTIPCMQTPIYKEQALRFIRRKKSEFITVKKANRSLQLNQYLADNRVISSKEFFDIKSDAEKANANYQTLIIDQVNEWQTDLLKYKLEMSNYEAEKMQLDSECLSYVIRAPVSGSIQGINNRYAGCAIQSNESICIISPESGLMAECYVSARDFGLVRVNETARFQIHAFDYNYFGSFTGRITSADNDYSLIDNKPVFRIRCSFDEKQVFVRRSVHIKLKKGLTLQARFLMGTRPIWRLIFEKMNDWINPSAPPIA